MAAFLTKTFYVAMATSLTEAVGHEVTPDQVKQAVAVTFPTNNGGKKGKKGKRVDDGQPKRPASAYILYSVEKRPSVVEANPEASFREIGAILGKLWREESDAVRAKYQKQNEGLKAAYETEMAEFKRQKSGGADETEVKAEPAPKKAATPKKAAAAPKDETAAAAKPAAKKAAAKPRGPAKPKA